MTDKLNALVAEDDLQLRRVAVRMMQKLGYEVQAAENVAEAKRLIAASIREGRSNIAVVLTDWNMPDGLGAEVVQAARQAKIPVVLAMTGAANLNEQSIQEADPDALLKKPGDIQPETIRAAIRDALALEAHS